MRAREVKIASVLVHSTNTHTSVHWNRQRPGTKNCIWISHMGGRAHMLEAFSTTFQSADRKLPQKSRG